MAENYIFNPVIRPTPSGTNFIVPTVNYGEDGETPLFTVSNPGVVQLLGGGSVGSGTGGSGISQMYLIRGSQWVPVGDGTQVSGVSSQALYTVPALQLGGQWSAAVLSDGSNGANIGAVGVYASDGTNWNRVTPTNPMPVSSQGISPYISGSISAVPTSGTSVTIPFGTLGDTRLFDISTVTVAVVNSGSSESIVSAQLQFTDTIGGQEVIISYELPSVSIATDSNQTFFIPISKGILKNVQLIVNFTAAPTAGNVYAQLALQSFNQQFRNKVINVLNNVSVPISSWYSSPIMSCDGYKTVSIAFDWADGYSMVNNSNYAINFYMDPAGNVGAGLTQWGTGTFSEGTNVVSISGPYFSLQVKNTDTSSAHPVDAYVYLLPN